MFYVCGKIIMAVTVGVGMRAESPRLSPVTRHRASQGLGSRVESLFCLHPKPNQPGRKSRAVEMDSADQVSIEIIWTLTFGIIWLNLSRYVVNCPPPPSHAHLLQLASMGTFQVLKLPLGLIRVLEWVS